MSAKIIQLISGPRNLSTALMYSFSQRNDTNVVDEPYYGAYLSKFHIDHLGKDEILNQMETNFDKITQTIVEWNQSPIYFVKNMAHHLLNRKVDFIEKFQNVFLIRNPYQLIASFAQVIPNPTMHDIGLKHEYDLHQSLVKNNYDPVVLDSEILLKNPKSILIGLCDHLGIQFDDAMLSWQKGGIKEDGCWAKYWYDNVHKSTSFTQQKTSSRSLPQRCKPLYDEAKYYYEELSKHTLKA